ncbi:hypothetical protein LCGC14_1054260 [marine sediment metagenome]|uniref:Uncharacterized protein n=1 Tax=marine sediment metagenome TaxID=412755 RepID=A0A0F9MSH3_9ZZZZ
MKIHLAYQNIDTELELVPTHRPQRRFHISPQGKPATRQRFIKYTSKLSDEKVLNKENIVQELKNTDFEIDLELAGKKISRTHQITVSEDLIPIYNYSEYDVLTLPDGTRRERPYQQTIANINTSIPVRITEELADPQELMFNYVFRKSYYITHYDGVTYKFLFEIAERLHNAKKFARVDTFNAENKKREPLILTDGGRKFSRAYLAGTVKGETYRLVLYLFVQELTIPEVE